MISRLLLRCVLRLFPSGFRLRFQEEIEEYCRLRQLEAQAAGGVSAKPLPLELVCELMVAAARERFTDVAGSRPLTRCLAWLSGLIIAGMLASVVFIAFESLVRGPLLVLAKQEGAYRSAALRVVAMLVVIVALLGLHVSLLPRPKQRRQPPE